MIYRFSNSEHVAYEAIFNAITRLETFADITGVTLDERCLLSIYTRAIATNPMGYCYDPTRIEYRYYGNRYIVYFNKLEEADKKFISLCSAVEFERMRIYENASKYTDPYDKLLSVYAYFVRSYEYCGQNRIKTINHSSASQHLYSKAVCEGFSLAFAEIVNALGITCDIISGRSSSRAGQEDHMWNIVTLDNKCYHLDVTWDICTKGNVEAFSYFMLSDNDIGLDHSWDTAKFPQCSDDSLDWYKGNGAYIRTADELKALIQRKISEKSKSISFRAADTFSYRGNIVRIINDYSYSLKSPIKNIEFSINEQCRTMSFKIEYRDTDQYL